MTAKKKKIQGTRKPVTRRKERLPNFYPDKDIVNALRDSDGVVTRAARRLKCHREVIISRARHVPEIAALINTRYQRMGEQAEEALLSLLKQHDWRAIEKCLRLLPGDPFGLKEPQKPQETGQIPAQQNVLILNNVRENAQHMPIEALRGLVETIRQQRRSQGALPAPSQDLEGPDLEPEVKVLEPSSLIEEPDLEVVSRAEEPPQDPVFTPEKPSEEPPQDARS